MTAKEYLQQLQRLDVVIKQKISEKEELQRKAGSISAVDYSKEKVSTAPYGEAAFEKITDRICDLEDEINSEIDYFVDKKHKIINQIQSLTAAHYIDLLFKRYVQFKKFEQIAVEMNFTYRYVLELHGLALQNFETSYKNLLNPT